ncbi:hypothetical protein RGQ29_024537 [Quercus rubra]|uniref:Uncharacterized protein n=1 Tax=Quercus rubra TaxID=3512 RepID=A0AAN7INM1_QUERU|nr:hypothetical protein RGQ29_024537 [Quercus rubra]
MEHVISTEFHSRKAVGREAGESSKRITEEVPIQTTLSKRFKLVREAGKNVKNKSPMPKIQKVIFLLRNDKDFEKYYEPRPKYQLGEKYKLVLTSELIESSGKSMEEVHKKIQGNIKELRDCFEKEVTMDYYDEALAWLLFVDGCAILQFMYCANTKDKFKDLSIKDESVVAFGHQDLFLPKNQLPYSLFEWLMSLSKMKKQLEDSIDTFIEGFVKVPKDQHSTCWLNWLSTKLWQQRASEQQQRDSRKTRNSEKKSQDQSISLDIREPERMHIHLLDKVRTRLLANHDIFFSTLLCFGFLRLPPIIVDDSTRPKFFNLIAYEMCPDFNNDYGVFSYISFLDSLIDEANDVKELRKAGILYCDEEVTQLFNEIGTDLVPNMYSDVRSRIQKYYKNKVKTWISQAIHNHFSSPWTILAFSWRFIGTCSQFCRDLVHCPLA